MTNFTFVTNYQTEFYQYATQEFANACKRLGVYNLPNSFILYLYFLLAVIVILTCIIIYQHKNTIREWFKKPPESI